MSDSDDLWLQLSTSLKSQASDAVWSAGLNKLRLVDFTGDDLVLGVPNQIQLQRVQQRYLPFITENARAVIGRDIHVSLTIAQPAESALEEPEAAPVPSAAYAPSVDRPTRLDPRMTFDSFVPGPSNRLAFAAAQSVAETPGRA